MRVSEASELRATPSISKVPVPVTSRLDAAARAFEAVTLSAPSETWVRPVKLFAPESVNTPAPVLLSAAVPEAGPLPVIWPAKVSSLVWFTASPPVPAAPSAMRVPLAPDRLPMPWGLSSRFSTAEPSRLTAPPSGRADAAAVLSVPTRMVVPPE